MSDVVALVVPLAIVGAIAVAVSIVVRRGVPPAQRTNVHWQRSGVYLGIVVVALILFVRLAFAAFRGQVPVHNTTSGPNPASDQRRCTAWSES